MRVLYFHQHFSTPSGSSGTRSYEMAKRLIARGHKVTIVCGSSQMSNTGLSGKSLNRMRRGFVDGIEVIELDLPYSNYDTLIKRSTTFFHFAWLSIILVMTLDYDLVFATSTPLTAGIPGIIAKMLRNKPFVFEVRDLWPELPREMGVITNPVILGAMSILEWMSYHFAQGCIGLSPGIVNGIRKRGISESRIIMIPNACDIELFNPSNEGFTRPQGVGYGDLLAVFTGAHGIANGLDAVLDVAALLKKRRRSDIKILFIGDGNKKPTLVERCSKEGLDNCLFLGPVEKVKLTVLMQCADVGLMTLANVPAFYYGTSPNKFFDYIASGLPVVNNYPGWLAEMIVQRECGIAVEPENAEAFADALEKLANDRTLISKMGYNARALAEEKFNRQRIADRFVDFLESMTRHPSNSPQK